MITSETFQAVTRGMGEAPRSVEPLAGATSSEVYRLRFAGRDAILRLFIAARWDSPAAALSQREFVILREAASSALPAPAPLATLPGNGIVMSWLPGSVRVPKQAVADWVDTMARVLVQIHTSGTDVPYAFESWNGIRDRSAPNWWAEDSLWAAARRLIAVQPPYEPVFIHRDYHPLNLLWQGEDISGVVDWINACMGPAGVDVAHCRLNLALMYGNEAADRFLAAYRRYAPGYVHDPYWDVDDAFSLLPDAAPYAPWAEFGLTGIGPETVRLRLQAFIRSAISR